MTWADCLVALQQRQVDAVSTDDTILAGLVAQDPYLHIVGPSLNEEPYGIGINLENTGLVRFVNGTLERIRRDGTWNTLYRKWLTVLGPAPAPPVPRYVGLMADPDDEPRRPIDDGRRRGPGDPARRRHRRATPLATMRPMADPGRVPPRFRRLDGHARSAPPRPSRRTTTTVTRPVSPIRRLGGGLVEVPRVPETRSARRADDQSGGRRVQAVLLELRQAGRAVVLGRQGTVRGLVPALRQPVLVPAATESGRHGRRTVRDQGLHRARRPGLGLSGVRHQRQRPARRAQGPGALRRRRGTGHRDGRAPVPRRGDPPGDREDLQLRRARRQARRSRRLHRDGVRRRNVAQAGQGQQAAGRPGDRLHAGDPARPRVSALRSGWSTTTSSPRTS